MTKQAGAPFFTVKQAMWALNVHADIREAIEFLESTPKQTLWTAVSKFQLKDESELQSEYNTVLAAMHDDSSAAHRHCVKFFASQA